ncbi:MAG: HORMA domain containing protein [Acidobacteriota bacterium]
MTTAVYINTRAHSVTYVTDKLLTTLKNIIRLSGLNPEKLTKEWVVLERGIKRWLETEDLEQLHLEVYNPDTDGLVGRWDLELHYGFQGDGTFWQDPEAIKYHIRKQGLWPSDCEYRVVAKTKDGRPEVNGWSSTTLRSTDGFVKQSIGTMIDGSGLSSAAGYWRKVS